MLGFYRVVFTAAGPVARRISGAIKDTALKLSWTECSQRLPFRQAHFEEALPAACQTLSRALLLWTEIDPAEGKTSSAATWHVAARNNSLRARTRVALQRWHDCSTYSEHGWRKFQQIDPA